MIRNHFSTYFFVEYFSTLEKKTWLFYIKHQLFFKSYFSSQCMFEIKCVRNYIILRLCYIGGKCMLLANHATLGKFTLPTHMQACLNPCAWFMSFQKSFLNFSKVKMAFLVLWANRQSCFAFFLMSQYIVVNLPLPQIFFLDFLVGNK